MKMLRLLLSALLMLSAVCMMANDDSWEKYGPTKQCGFGFIARAGYTMGATTPLPVPEYVREKKLYKPYGGAMAGFEAYKMFNRRWGLKLGLHVSRQGFHSEANVKNYQVKVNLLGTIFEGRFTGLNKTHMRMTALTMPLLANFRICPRWNISLGPYGTLYVNRYFHTQSAQNSDGVGYLRIGGPTGPKKYITETPEIDFSEHMRKLGGGIEFGADYQVLRHVNIFALMDWGISGAIDPDFVTIKYKMHHLYGTIGLAYRY